MKEELQSASKQMEREIREAYIFLREKNMSVPSDTLEFMLQASLRALNDPYNGLTPDTVKEMLTALTTIYGLTAKTGVPRLEFLAAVVNPVREKAEKELKK